MPHANRIAKESRMRQFENETEADKETAREPLPKNFRIVKRASGFLTIAAQAALQMEQMLESAKHTDGNTACSATEQMAGSTELGRAKRENEKCSAKNAKQQQQRGREQCEAAPAENTAEQQQLEAQNGAKWQQWETERDNDEWEPTEMEWMQIRHTCRAQKVLPTITAFLNCMLQRGVKSPSVQDAVASTIKNAKRIETDPKPLVLSGRMVHAAASEIVVLTAEGYAAQVAWAEEPEPMESFADLFAAAGGQLRNIIQLSNAELTCEQAEKAYSDRMEQAAEDRASRDAGLWTKVKKQCEAEGIRGIPALPFHPLSDAGPKDHSDNSHVEQLLAKGTVEKLLACWEWKWSAHGVKWIFPFTENRINEGHTALATTAAAGKETTAFTRMINAALLMLEVWELSLIHI